MDAKADNHISYDFTLLIEGRALDKKTDGRIATHNAVSYVMSTFIRHKDKHTVSSVQRERRDAIK